jgi:hypothetical protein
VHSMSALQVRDLEYPLGYSKGVRKRAEARRHGRILVRTISPARQVYIIAASFHRGAFHGSARESEFSLSERVLDSNRSMNF